MTFLMTVQEVIGRADKLIERVFDPSKSGIAVLTGASGTTCPLIWEG